MRRVYKKKKYLFGLIVIVALAALLYLILPDRGVTDGQYSRTGTPGAAQIPSSGFNKNAYPTDKADSLWVVVNKGRTLPGSYVPANLVVPHIMLQGASTDSNMHVRADTAAALEQLVDGAQNQGIDLMLLSGYRSYDYQVGVYSAFVRQDEVQNADTFSARPGHSEHQTGLAAGLGAAAGKCALDQCFGDLPEGKWLAQNAYKYGFIIRYQKNTQNLTGYEYEPWHVRYVGQPLAAKLQVSGQTLEQFFGLPTYTDYPVQSLTLKS